MDSPEKINLSEKDFQLIIEALDYLPHRDEMGELMGNFLMGFMANDEDSMDRLKKEHEKKMRNKKHEQDMLKEDIKILQGKILMLKRFLIGNNALNETTNIINHVQ